MKHAIETNEAPITTPLAKVALTCSEHDVTVMLHAAQTFFPEVAPSIRTALQSSRNK